MTSSKVLCPLCGMNNACGMANGGTTCWCFDTPFDAAALEAIPEGARSKVCICQACASGRGPLEGDEPADFDVFATRGVVAGS